MNNSVAFNAGHAFGMVAFFVGMLAIGVYFGNRLGKRRDHGVFVRWPVGVALAIDLLALLGQCAGPAKAQSALADVVVEQRVAGSSAGFPNEFDADFITRYNAGVHDGMVDTIRKAGVTVAPEEVKTTTEVISFGAHKVLKSKMTLASRLFAYQFGRGI